MDMAASGLNDFLITDPLNQPGVVERVPEGVTMVDLDDVPYRAEPQVRCAFCKQYQWHHDGYFAILSDGTKAPCGNCCAEKFDGVKKKTIDRNRTRLKRERDDRNRAMALSADNDLIERIAARCDKIGAETSAICYYLQHVLRRGSFKEMEERGIRGLEFLDGPPELSRVRRVIASLGRLRMVKDAKVDDWLAKREEAVARIRKAAQFVVAGADFFEVDNLALIEAWAKDRGRFYGVQKFRLKQRTLHAHGTAIMWQNFLVPRIEVPGKVRKFAEGQG